MQRFVLAVGRFSSKYYSTQCVYLFLPLKNALTASNVFMCNSDVFLGKIRVSNSRKYLGTSWCGNFVGPSVKTSA